MLVLTRKKQETIRIGDEITITVLRIKGKSVRLGITAPLECPVLRGELEERIAADSDSDSDPNLKTVRSRLRSARRPSISNGQDEDRSKRLLQPTGEGPNSPREEIASLRSAIPSGADGNQSKAPLRLQVRSRGVVGDIGVCLDH